MLADFFSTLLELGGVERVSDNQDSIHDGMESAEIGVVAWSQPLQCEAAVWPDDSGVECAGASIIYTGQMGDRVIGRCRVVPSNGGSAGCGGRFWDEIG